MSNLNEGSKRQQNYSIHIQDNYLTVIENIYNNSTSFKKEEPATIILLLCACSFIINIVESWVTFHTEETNNYEKST